MQRRGLKYTLVYFIFLLFYIFFAIEADGAIEYNPDIMGLLTITTTPAEAIILVTDSNDTVVEESAVGVYPVVIGRTYTYTVSADTYAPQTANIEIENAIEEVDITLAKPILTINVTPIGINPTITVTDEEGAPVEANVDETYTVDMGATYTVTVTKTGYVAYTDDVVISAKDATLDVELVLLSDAKAITAFSFAGLEPAVVGTIDEEAKTIALTVPNGTVVTALVATFINSEKSSVKVGEVAQESGVTANDFTTPVSYVVTAEDETTSTYTVTVTIAEA